MIETRSGPSLERLHEIAQSEILRLRGPETQSPVRRYGRRSKRLALAGLGIVNTTCAQGVALCYLMQAR